MIDSLNGWQTCRQCRHFKEEQIRKDRLFGELKETDWCVVKGGHIDRIEGGQHCLMFIRRLFTDNHNHNETD